MTDKITAVGVDQPSNTMLATHNDNRLLNALWGGTTTMRAAGKLYLPQEPAEQDRDYALRLERTVLFNAFKRTIQQAVGKIFATPATISDDAPPVLQMFEEDVDMEGNDLTQFAVNLAQNAIKSGVTYLMTDYPLVIGQDDLPMTLQDERESGARPYWINIVIDDVLEIRSERIQGVEKCTLFRFKERVDSFSADPHTFNSVHLEQVKVLRLVDSVVTCEIWRKDNSTVGSKTWVLFQPAQVIPKLEYIPIVPVYTNRTGFMLGRCPLYDLAEINLAHWQVTSDHSHILHFAAVPVYFGKGLTSAIDPDTGLPKPIVISPNSLVYTEDSQGDLKIVEHTGKSIESQRQQLKDYEDKMAILGLELYVNQPGAMTATQKAIETAQANSIIKQIAGNIQDALEQSLTTVVWYFNMPVGTTVDVVMGFDYSDYVGDNSDAQYLLNAHKAGLITAAAVVEELRRRNIINRNVDVKNVIPPSSAQTTGINTSLENGESDDLPENNVPMGE